ncbi:MAG TPA: hypothetical protein PKC28_14875 [Bdellovibrionales bacterium]|nr:hypothetical protein [Bdellovibrionales bacterium]
MRMGHEDLAYYNVGGKPAEIFRRQIAHQGPAVQILNFLSTEEVDLLIEIERGVPSERRDVRYPIENMSYTNGPWSEDPRALFLKERLHAFLGPFEVWGGNYFDISHPYLPHVDNGEKLGFANFKNLVFPLRTDPAGGRTHLVLFRQRYFGDNTGFFASGDIVGREVTATGTLCEYSRVLHIENDSTLDELTLSTTLAHLNPRNLVGFSIERIIPWTIGSCIAFDSSQIHCSADFRRQGITRKFGLSLFTYLS